MFVHNRARRQDVALTDDVLRQRAPSIFALEAWQNMSAKYRFVPTIDVVNKMRDEGFVPMSAMQGRTRIPGKSAFTRHMIRFRRIQDVEAMDKVGAECLEICVANAHDGTSSYQVDAGVFRLVCLNGMMVSAGDLQCIRSRHSGAADLPAQVIDASFEIIEQAPAIMGAIADMRATKLDSATQEAFATAALELRESPLVVSPRHALQPRRPEDRNEPNGQRDLWRTFNVVQEHIIRGGVPAYNANNRRMHTRAVTSVGEDIRLNRALWRLADEMRKITGGTRQAA